MVGKEANDLYADFAVIDSPSSWALGNSDNAYASDKTGFCLLTPKSLAYDEMIHTPGKAIVMKEIRLTLVGDEVRAAREKNA